MKQKCQGMPDQNNLDSIIFRKQSNLNFSEGKKQPTSKNYTPKQTPIYYWLHHLIRCSFEQNVTHSSVQHVLSEV